MKGVDKQEKNIQEFFKNFISSGNINNFDKNNVFIGSEMAFNLNLKVGDFLNLMSSSFVSTPYG